MARLSRLARRVLRHWTAERTTVRQGLTALTICVSVTILAGVVLGAMERLLAEQPGLLILVPSAIGMRGAIFGALGARLGTGILTGQYDGRIERGSFTRQNIEAAALLTLFTAGLSALIAWGTATIFGLDVIGLADLTLVSIVGAIASSAAVLPATLLLAKTAESRSWDMDAVGTPIITAAGDITALPALVLGVYALVHPISTAILGTIGLVSAGAALFVGLRTRFALLRRIVQESAPVLCYAALTQVLAGTVLSTRLDTLVTDPALLVAIPPFLSAGGALGGILAARLSSRLHLGLLEPARVPQGLALLEGSITTLLGAAGYATVGVLTLAAARVIGFPSPGAGEVLGATLLGGAFAVVLLFLVAYYTATASYRFGLDPDNYGFPVVSASMDFLGIVCLVAGIALVGVD
jgi:mgtE-like transporter